MPAIKRNFVKFVKSTPLPDLLLGGLERARGISYPDRLIGRRNFPAASPRKGGILVIAAHPDDAVLGMGFTLIRHRASGADVTVVFTTNGGGNWEGGNAAHNELSTRRFREACDSLSTIGISSRNVMSLGFPDAGLRRYIPEAAKDIASLIATQRPERIYVHAIEGGHRDHDVTSFLVQCVAPRLGVENVYEWAEYNKESPLAGPLLEIRFPSDPYVGDHPSWSTNFTEAERSLKEQMLAKYVSQLPLIRHYPFDQEVLRRANPVRLVPRLKYFANLSGPALHHLRVSKVTALGTHLPAEAAR